MTKSLSLQIMDSSLTLSHNMLWDNMFQHLNILKLFANFNHSPLTESINNQQLIKIIKSGSHPYIREQFIIKNRYLCFQSKTEFHFEYSNITKDSIHEKNLIFMFGISQKITKFTFWNCQFSQEFLYLLFYSPWIVKEISFADCRLGDTCAFQISHFKVTNIEKIYLRDDKISNRGIKSLMKIDFCCLKQLLLANTNITTDGIKLLIKRQPILKKWGIFQQKYFNEIILLQQLHHFSDLSESYKLQLHCGFSNKSDSAFSSFNYLAKMKICSETKSDLRFRQGQTSFYDTNQNISHKVFRCFKEVMNFV